MTSLLLDDFRGGLNLRDAPNQLQLTESPSEANFTLTERGGLKRRNGCLNLVALPGVSGKKAYIHYSASLDLWLCCRETAGAPNTFRLHTRPGDLSGSWTDRGQIAGGVGARAVFADWPGTTRYCLIGTDITSGGFGGMYTLDTTPTLTNRSTNEVVALAVWQNKAWTCQHVATTGDSANIANATRLARSAAGDPTTWGDSVDIRDKDATALTALGVVGGSLVVFKLRSTYRVIDSATGAYNTIDAGAGCVNARAVVPIRGRLYVWGTDGMYETDGTGPLKNVGDKLRPLYTDTLTDQSTIIGGVSDDRVIWSGVFGGPFAGTPELFEYSPQDGSIVMHAMASSSQDEFSSFASKGSILHAACTDGDDLFQMFTGIGANGGKDDATTFITSWTTPWLLPNSGMLSRLQRIRVQGIAGSGATVSVNVYKDWTYASPSQFDISTQIRAAASELQRAADLQALGHGSAFAIQIGNADSGSNTELSVRAMQFIDTPLQWPNPGYPKIKTLGPSPIPGPPVDRRGAD